MKNIINYDNKCKKSLLNVASSSPISLDISDTNSRPASLLGAASVDSGRARFGTDDSICGLEAPGVRSVLGGFASGFSNNGDDFILVELLGASQSHGGKSQENDLQSE